MGYPEPSIEERISLQFNISNPSHFMFNRTNTPSAVKMGVIVGMSNGGSVDIDISQVGRYLG